MEQPALLRASTDASTVKDDRLYVIRPIPGKGQGLVATSKIPKGTRILSESPVFKLPGLATNAQLVESLIIKKLKTLSKDQQRAILSAQRSCKYPPPVPGIVRTNALPLGSGATEGGLFLEASRINHACNPNAQNTWNANLDQLTIHAIKDVEKGEEITISYLDGSESYAARQLSLKSTFGFNCACELCSLPPAQRQQNDRRLDEITRLDGLIGDGMRIVSHTCGMSS